MRAEKRRKLLAGLVSTLSDPLTFFFSPNPILWCLDLVVLQASSASRLPTGLTALDYTLFDFQVFRHRHTADCVYQQIPFFSDSALVEGRYYCAYYQEKTLNLILHRILRYSMIVYSAEVKCATHPFSDKTSTVACTSFFVFLPLWPRIQSPFEA